MDRHTFELMVSREIQHALNELLPLHTSTGFVSRDLLQKQLQELCEHMEAAARDRPVLAVPGPIRSPASAGANRLLADGCAPACGVEDVLVALEP